MNNFDWESLGFESVGANDIGNSGLEFVDTALANIDPTDPATEQGEIAEQLEHAAAAEEAQQATDAAIEVGDYEAAAHHKEIAENEAWEAADNSMLDGATSTELESADLHQDQAMELEQLQAEQAQAGDYEAARDTANEATIEMQTADGLAAGQDHSGQAQLEADNMDWASWHEQQATESLDAAVDYAESGNLEAAESSLDSSVDQQAIADNYGDLGEHGGAVADFDPSADIQSNTYESYSTDVVDTSIDTSTTDDFTV